MTDQTAAGGDSTSDKSAVDLVVGKSTDKFFLWQQLPAWILGAAAILGGAALIAFPKNQSRDAWAAVIVGVLVAVMLSYRSAFTLNDDGKGGGGGGQTGPTGPTGPTGSTEPTGTGGPTGPTGSTGS